MTASEEIVRRAVEEYNRYRSPEAVARLVKVDDDGVLIEFSGTFCETCGVYDWLEDFAYELERLDERLTARIEAWRRASDRFLVKFTVRRQ